MKDLSKVWDRDDHPRLVTAIRAVYKAKDEAPCERCQTPTDRIIDYIGKLMRDCGCKGKDQITA